MDKPDYNPMYTMPKGRDIYPPVSSKKDTKVLPLQHYYPQNRNDLWVKHPAKKKGLYRKILSHVKVFWPIFIIIIISSAGYSACDTYVIGPLVKKNN